MVGLGVYTYGILMLIAALASIFMYKAAVEITKINESLIWRIRVFIGGFLSVMFSRNFVAHGGLVGKIGDAYNTMISNFNTANSFHLSHHHFGDASALRDLFDEHQTSKSHKWVLFAHLVDSALVWAILTSVGMGAVLTFYTM